MILTGENAEYANTLEGMLEGSVPDELTDEEQAELYTIYKMFHHDPILRKFIIGCFSLYTTAYVNRETEKLFAKMTKLVKELAEE